MGVEVTWDVDRKTWDGFVARCPNATFFHTAAWYEANRNLGYEPAAALLRIDGGAEALLPLAVRPSFKGLWKEAYAGIENGYGGLVSPSRLSRAHVESAYRAVRRRYPDMRVVANPFEAYPNWPGSGPLEPDTTLVVPLTDRDSQRRRMSATRQKHARRAARAGFELAVRTDLTADDASRFYPLYAAHAAHWDYGKWARDEAYFREVCEKAGTKLVLVTAHHGGRAVGFRLLGLTGPVVMDLFLATDREFDDRHVGTFLAEAAMAWCREAGHTGFDLQPSGRLEGVRAYKASLGATEIPHGHMVLRGVAGRSLDTLWRLARPGAA